MKTKYYQLRERADEVVSIGVIKSVDGVFDLEQIKKALESHFDESVSDIVIEEYGWEGSITITFRLETREDKETVDGEETWLYF